MVVIPEDLKYKRPETPVNNYADSLVHDKLHKLRITPRSLLDEVFVRRVTLDITGTLPDQKTYDEFMADASADKRAKLIDRLLERKEFTEMWVMKFAELLQIQTDENQGMSYKATLLYFNWLKDRIANNVPMDQIVRELLTSTGGTFVNPSTNYYQVERDGLKITENVAQVFMGMRFNAPMSQPSFRPVDPRRLLFFRFFLQSDRSQKSGRSSRIHNLQPQERRNQSPDPQQTLASQVPGEMLLR